MQDMGLRLSVGGHDIGLIAVAPYLDTSGSICPRLLRLGGRYDANSCLGVGDMWTLLSPPYRGVCPRPLHLGSGDKGVSYIRNLPEAQTGREEIWPPGQNEKNRIENNEKK